ncbi:MAG: hypothetical protein IJH04_01250 [Eggerthellaceae bacterium]|nr:hypothetical protein [Eggerthellaceae bacterium]
MLFLLTGDIQTGKTRWLEKLVSELESQNVTSVGVIAPGIWADRRNSNEPSDFVDANGFEKLGIENLLLPEKQRIRFALRRDIAEKEGALDSASQSNEAKLAWCIDDAAIVAVNSHFAQLRTGHMAQRASSAGALLVVDELGQLELLRNRGLTEAVEMLEDGPSSHAAHALIVVREWLLPHVENRFEKWGDKRCILPDDEGMRCVQDAFGLCS